MGNFAAPFSLLQPVHVDPSRYAQQYEQLQAMAQARQIRQQEMAANAQTQQINQIKIQQAERLQQGQQILSQAYKDAAGDLDKTQQLLMERGAPGETIQDFEKHRFEMREKLSKLTKEELENIKTRRDQLRGAAMAFEEQPDDVKAQQYPAFLQRQLQNGNMTPAENQQMLQAHPTYPGAAQMTYFTHELRSGSQAAEEGLKAAAEKRAQDEEARKVKAEAIQALSTVEYDPKTGLPTEQGMATYKALREQYGPKVLPPAQALRPGDIPRMVRGQVSAKDQPEYDIKTRAAAIMQSTQPGDLDSQVDGLIPPTGDTAALNARTKILVRNGYATGDLSKVQAALKDASDQIGRTETAVRTARETKPIKIETAAGIATARAPKLSDEAEELAAVKLLNGEPIPGFARSPVAVARITDRAAQIAKENGMSARQVILEQHSAKANTQAYQKLNTAYATLKPFGEMAEKNADILEKKIAEVPDLGATFLNTPVRELASKFGSTRMAAFQAAILPVQNEFARVLNSATGAGVLSDSARHEMQIAIQPGATVAQMRAALNVFRQEWKNRKESVETQLEDLKSKSVIGGGEQGKIRVRRKSDGATGSMDAKDFDPSKYDRL